MRINLVSILFFMLTFSSICISQRPTSNYDMRRELSPKRLTIAMWDFSLQFMHHKNGCYEDFNKSLDELIERKFNTVRIDAYPLIIGLLDSLNQEITFPANPQYNWGQTDKDYRHKIAVELVEFLKIAKQKKLNIILSTWNMDCKEFPNIRDMYADKHKQWRAWEKVLDMLKEHNLLDNVLYVDIDQEFPYFSPFQKTIDSMKDISTSSDVTKSRLMRWNKKQMDFVYNLLDSTLVHFQTKYPGIRFTYSFTEFWEEVRYMKLKSLDVLELHVWLTQSPRFLSRSQFDNMNKIRSSDTNYSDYMYRLNESFKAMRPMFKKDMANRMRFAKEWSEEIAAPLVTTEAWGPWWHMDNKYLTWQWLYDWCEECMSMASEEEFWGVTPWNYSHPYWENWKNIKWYKKVNEKFIRE